MLVLFALYAIVYLPIAITSIIDVPAAADNIAMLFLYRYYKLQMLLLEIIFLHFKRNQNMFCYDMGNVEDSSYRTILKNLCNNVQHFQLSLVGSLPPAAVQEDAEEGY